MDHHTPAASLTPPQFTSAQWAQVVARLRLSPQQSNIVALVLQGRRDKQIAYELGRSSATVRTHIRNTYTRLNVQDRVELVLTIFAAASSELTNQRSGMCNHNTPRQNGGSIG